MSIEILEADYANEVHARDIILLMNEYALDPMGGGKALSNYVKNNLVTELQKQPNAWSLICYVDTKAAGLINCFDGFSTFKCSPLVNIHDLTVHSDFRGIKLSQRMLVAVEEIAKARGSCKLTLEVLEGNTIAKNAYLKYGFSPYQLNPEYGHAVFWEKSL